MTITPPTLSEMESHLADSSGGDIASLQHSDLSTYQFDYVIKGDSPTLSEMAHYFEVRDALAHHGIKGMKWGIRRSDRELAALRNEDGEDIGGIRTRSRKDAKTLKGMKAGQAVVIESSDGSGQPMAVVKLKDGSFKQVHISADAQNAVRTLNKEQVEMSTREIKEAAARAKAIEDYNKYFGPKDEGPNAELQAAVERLQLEQKYSQAYATLNPTKMQRASNFISKAAPIYDTYVKINKASGGRLSTTLSEVVDQLKGATEANTPAGGRVKKSFGGTNSVSIKSKKSPGVKNVTTIKRKGS